MPLPPTSLRTFLVSARTTLNQAIKHSSPVTFVVGNESADLDSICSAVLLSYLQTHIPRPSSSTTHPQTYIPLSNLPFSDLSLRPELLPVLSSAKLSIEDLITLSDIQTHQKPEGKVTWAVKPENTRWLLVDHNALQGELGRIFGGRVVGCIDHHDEEGKVPKDGEVRVVEKSGSCASLIVENCREGWAELARQRKEKGEIRGTDGDEDGGWNQELARLAIAPVLIDTNNLTSEHKTKDVDRRAAEFLERILNEEDKSWDRNAFFKEVTKAKQDIGGLPLRDILRKDYKEWNENGMKLGVSSVVKDLSFLLQNVGAEEKFYPTIKEWAKERGLEICAIMTTSHQEGVFKRELFVWALSEKAVLAAKTFEKMGREKFGLAQWKEGKFDKDFEGEGMWRRCWWQERVEHSRKQVAPLMRTAINE